MKQTKKPSYALRAACVLLCLVLISVHFSTGLYARYATGAAGADDARLARFHVSAELSGQADGSYLISMQNRSDTAVRYSLVFLAEDPEAFSEVRLGEESRAVGPDGSAVFADLGILAPGAPGSLTMELTLNPDADGETLPGALLDFSNDSTAVLDDTLPFTVTLRCEQAD